MCVIKLLLGTIPAGILLIRFPLLSKLEIRSFCKKLPISRTVMGAQSPQY